MSEGSNASIPPDLESFWCFAVMLDFFFFLTIRLEEGLAVAEIEESCLDHSFCFSRLHLLLKFVDAAEVSIDACFELPLEEEESISLGFILSSCLAAALESAGVLLPVVPFFLLVVLDDLHMFSWYCWVDGSL